MVRHIKIVAVLHIVYSLLGLGIALLVSSILNIIGNFIDDQEAAVFLSIIANGLTILFAVLALPGIIGGIGIIKRKEWARVLVLIVSVLDLIHFPLGTMIGAYSIWALVQPEVLQEFGKKIAE